MSELLMSERFFRRGLLRCVAVAGVCVPFILWPDLAQATTPAFEGKSLAQVAKALGAKSVTASADVRLNTLDYAENGAAVPIEMAASLAGIEQIVLFVEKNPTPLVAVFKPKEAVDAALTVNTKMAHTTMVYAMVILSDGRALYSKKEVNVVLGSCGTISDTSDNLDVKRSTEPTRIRAQIQGESALVRMRMAHEMESGQRKNAAGKLVPAWHINQVSAQLNGKLVMTADWGPGISRNPYLQFNLKKVRAGDKLTVTWRDTQGAVREDYLLLN